MSDEPIPDDVRDYIINHVHSIAQLEALLLLRARPEESWQLVKMAQRLYISEPEVSDALSRLVEGGIVSFEHGMFAYRPSTEIRGLIDRVAMTYTRHLIPVTNLIHTRPTRISQFADAFKFRKDR
jgi:DNA-binding MarR family transcriptional regulator